MEHAGQPRPESRACHNGRMSQRVFVIGGSGLVGARLVRQLRDAGAEVTSCDVVPSPVDGIRHLPLDILHDDVGRAIDEGRPHAVVHLVARVDPPNGQEGRAKMRALHIEGITRVVRGAVANGVKRFVLASSACVYGAHPDNPIPLVESAPLRPREDFPYALDKVSQEEVLEREGAGMSTAIVRPAVIYAKEARNYLTEVLRYAPKILPAIDGRRPPLQFVHAEDVATALRLIANASATGAFNVGADAIAYDRVAQICGLKVVPLPRRALAPAANFGARLLPSRFRAPAYVLDQLAYPFVVDSHRLRSECSFEFAFSSEDALREMLAGRRKLGRPKPE